MIKAPGAQRRRAAHLGRQPHLGERKDSFAPIYAFRPGKGMVARENPSDNAQKRRSNGRREGGEENFPSHLKKRE